MIILDDFKRNKSNTKGLFFILFFRISHFCSKNFLLKIIGFPIRVFYRIFIQWILAIDIPDVTDIGSGLAVYHGMGLVINEKSKIGKNVTIRHNTTIGNSRSGGKCPIIEDNVNIGANCVIIGDIQIGKNSIVGAGSVVINSIPPNCIAVGNPARVVKTLE